MAETDARSGALAGIRVIDLTRVLSGPFCTMLLADLGADVIKVEGPKEGDPIRQQGTIVDGVNWYFAAFNRSKRSLTLDLRSEPGRVILVELLRTADVLVENFRPGVLTDMGLDQPHLDAINPRLVTCSINGFGSTGPYAQRPAFDFIAQAMSGFMAVNGEADGPPMRAAPPVTDLVAGLYGTIAILAALHARQSTGRGQRVESAMLNGIFSLHAYLAVEFLGTGRTPARTGNDHPILYPYGLFRTADGEIAIAPANDTMVRRLLGVLDLAWMLANERWSTNERRRAHRGEVKALIDERLAATTSEVWIERLNRAGVPCGPVQSLAQAFADPQLLAQEMVIEIPRAGGGTVRTMGFPMKLAATPCAVQRPAPTLGEHTAEILAELGYAPAQIAALAADGTV